MTYDEIMERMLSNVSDAYDKREGSIIWDAISPAAIELNNMYMAFDSMLEEAFGDTASREYLIRLGAERGLKPYQASKSVVKGVFTPSTIEIPIGTRFNGNKASYTVIEQISDGAYKLECATAGSIGNGYVGIILPIDYIEGLETANITDILIYGEDEEETEHFRNRYMNSFDERSFAGNKHDYIEKTVAISGVGACKVEPVWNGGGTVRLTVLDSNYGAASAELIKRVQDEFDPNMDGMGNGLAPIGHIVMIRTAETVSISVTINITFDTGYSWSTHRVQIENALKGYLNDLCESWQDESGLIVRVSLIESKLLSIDGIKDVSGTTINGAASNLILDEFEIPTFGGISG